MISLYVFLSELSCPEDCSNAGDCNTSTGKCSCDDGRHGADCSSKRNFDVILYAL